MKISYRIFLGFVVLLAAGFIVFVAWMARDVNTQPKKSMEETMVDIAHILASYLEECIDPDDGGIHTQQLAGFLARAGERRFRAQIYELDKKQTALDVYVTDKQGKVIFSTRPEWEGQDFSRRRDVYRALRERYGARTTREDPGDALSSVAYVAAPIRSGDQIIGACTVSKSWKSINRFNESAQGKILAIAVTLFAAALVLSFFISRWITRPIRELTDYADDVKEGRRALLPELGGGEVKTLGESFEQMRESLEGRQYIEKYVQTLTHQLKGPLSAIRGAAELLQEELPETDRQRFVSNIEGESNRMLRIVERMLELSALEQQKELRNVEKVNLSALVSELVDDMMVKLKQKEIVLVLKVGKDFSFNGERFLVYQAVYNLLQNAVEFTPVGGSITIEIKEDWNRLFLIIRDTGPGIPEYALDKLFDKFYSLPRPGTGKKSSGLGLSLVKEVAQLHKGSIAIKNNKPTGATAILKLPMDLN